VTATGDLSEDLKNVIEGYLAGHRSRSLATLSRASGVSYTTIRRLAQKEGNPTAEPVLKIVDAALTNEEKIAFINRHYPEIASTINKFQRENYSPSSPRQELLKLFYTRDPHNFILNIAQTERGTTEADVRRLSGERGLEALAELVEHEILVRETSENREFFRLVPMLSHDCDMAIAQIKLSADYFDRSLVGTKAARLFHGTASVNRRTLEQIHDIVSAAIRDIVAVKDDPRSAGDIPIFVDMMMNVYDKAPLNRTEEPSR